MSMLRWKTKLVAIALGFIGGFPLEASDNFLILCETVWNKTQAPRTRCMRETIPTEVPVNETALDLLHERQIPYMKETFNLSSCVTINDSSRLRLELRSTCEGEDQLIEFTSIWPIDLRSKQYFRTDFINNLEEGVRQFFNRRYNPEVSDGPVFEWNR